MNIEENERLKELVNPTTQIFIDTQDMEERYGQELYEDYLKEQLEDYKSRIEKANNWIDKHIETYTKNNITIIDWDTFADPRQLKNILQGVGKDE